jgi:hypothetical protein
MKTYIYSYRLTSFGGAAPCYDNGLYSLAICKVDMRRAIGQRWYEENKPNIWIIGINGKGLCRENPHFVSDELLYIAKVTDVVLFEDYFCDTLNNRKDKIYIPWNGKDKYDKLFGDEKKFIYSGGFDLGGTFIHNESYLQDRDWDIKHTNSPKYVLLSDKFAFLDELSSSNIKNILGDTNLSRGRRHRIMEGSDEINKMLEQEIFGHENHGINNLPIEFRQLEKVCGCK